MATVTTRRKARKELPAMPPPPDLPLYRFSVEQYHQMIRAGVLREGERAELLEGWIVAKMTRNPPHDSTLTRLYPLLLRSLSDNWVVRVQCALTIRQSEPEPDVAVVRGPDSRYNTRHPGPQDTALVIEVADTSLDEDRGIKLRTYARSRIGLYWIVNLPAAQVEVYSDPRGGRTPSYRRRQDYGASGSVPLVLGGQDFGTAPVRELLP
jgi:Uma2 family endonuclease